MLQNHAENIIEQCFSTVIHCSDGFFFMAPKHTSQQFFCNLFHEWKIITISIVDELSYWQFSVVFVVAKVHSIKLKFWSKYSKKFLQNFFFHLLICESIENLSFAKFNYRHLLEIFAVKEAAENNFVFCVD